MKSLFIATFVLVNTTLALAQTKVYDDGTKLNAIFQSEDESKEIYDGLDVEEINGRSGTAKFFITKDNVASIYCTHSKIPMGIQYSCTFSIAYGQPSSVKTPVFKENDSLHASINDLDDAKNLYDLLNLSSANGRSGNAHFYYSEDRKASVYCSKSNIPVGIPYGCRISIEIP